MRRFLYTMGGKPLPEPVEVPADWKDPASGHTGDLGKFEYAGLRATDGTPIDSREAHRRYMRENNLALASDYKNTWAAARKERERVLNGEAGREARKHAVAQAMERHRRGR